MSAFDELMDLIEECKDAVADGKISNDERSRLMQRYWNLIKALKEAQNLLYGTFLEFCYWTNS